MKKILTLLMFAFLTVTAGATGKQLYLCGDTPAGNGWGHGAANQVAMTYNSETGVNTAEITTTKDTYFCITEGGTEDTDTDWNDFNSNYRYSCSSFKAVRGSYKLEKLGDNSMMLPAGSYKLTIDSENMTMMLSCNTTFTITVYNQDWEQLALYNWGSVSGETLGGWPGVVLYDGTNTVGNENVSVSKEGNVFTVTLSASLLTEHLIINNNNHGKQLADINSIENGSNYTVWETKPTSFSNRFYVINDGDWSVLQLYNWGDGGDVFGGWPGLNIVDGSTSIAKIRNAGTTTDNKTIYEVELGDNTGWKNLILNNKSGDDGEQFDISTNEAPLVSGTYYSTSSKASVSAPSYKLTTANEYTTYVTPDAMNFSGLDVKAYKASSANASAVTLTEVTAVPAGTPLILKGTGTFSVPAIASAEAIEGNLLKAGGVSIGGSDKYDYILKSDALFHRVTTESALAADKAYLHLDGAPVSARSLNIEFEDGETTGIETVNSEEVKVKSYYNLAGQRIAQPTRGLYITNGKKVLLP